jgi:hypothetical protein
MTVCVCVWVCVCVHDACVQSALALSDCVYNHDACVFVSVMCMFVLLCVPSWCGFLVGCVYTCVCVCVCVCVRIYVHSCAHASVHPCVCKHVCKGVREMKKSHISVLSSGVLGAGFPTSLVLVDPLVNLGNALNMYKNVGENGLYIHWLIFFVPCKSRSSYCMILYNHGEVVLEDDTTSIGFSR